VDFAGYPEATGQPMEYCAKVGTGPVKNASSGMPQLSRPNGTGVFLGGRFSEKEVIAYGGISKESQLKVRASNRIRAQPNADTSQMDRAQQQASARDPSFYSGTKHLNNFTFTSFSHDEVVSRAATLRVSLGRTKSQILDSVNFLKDIDLERTLITLKQKEEKDFASPDDLYY
jgi:hypothetical protein